jgi:hypothetical protein
MRYELSIIINFGGAPSVMMTIYGAPVVGFALILEGEDTRIAR